MRADMSPEAIWRRLAQASELRDLCVWLGKAKAAPVISGGTNKYDQQRWPERCRGEYE